MQRVERRQQCAALVGFDIGAGARGQGQRRAHRILRAGRQQAQQVQRAARLRAGARQALAAERLHAHHRADDIAVHVQVAHVRTLDDMRDGLVDAGMDTQRQAIAGAVDLLDEPGQASAIRILGRALPAHHVQHRAEDLARQVRQAVEFDHSGRHEGAVRAGSRHRRVHRRLMHASALGAHRVDMAGDAVARLGVDHRADVGGQAVRIAHRQLGHAALEHGEHAVGHIVLQAQHAQRRAALPRRIESRRQHIRHHLLGQRRRVDDHRVLAAGLGNQRDGRAVGVEAAGQRALQDARHLGRAGEHHALGARIPDQRRADGLASARQQLHRAGRHAGLAQDAHRLRGDQRGLLGGLGQHRVAGGQRRAHLAGEDRQREVPRADADHRAERAVRIVGEPAAHLRRVVAQEIHRLAHFGDGIGQRLARLADDQAHQALHLAFHQVGRALEQRGARLGRGGLPDRRGGGGGRQRGIHIRRRCLGHVADHVAQVGRVAHRLRRAPRVRRIADGRRGRPSHTGAREQGGRQRGEPLLVGQVDARRIGAHIAVELARQRDLRMRQAQRAFFCVHRFHHRHRVGDQRVERDRLVGDAVDEGGVGAVLQQAAHQVGQQCLVRADRRVDAARPVELARLAADHLFVQRLAHAVQALEFVLAGVIVLAGHVIDGRQRVGVVRGELREHGIGRGQQLARAGQVRHVGVDLARVDRVALQAIDLGALDLAVPVGALDQADHQAVLAAARQVDDVVQHERAALLVALHHEAEAVPAGQLGREAQALEQVERQLQAVGLFGVDVDADVVLAGQHRQAFHARV